MKYLCVFLLVILSFIAGTVSAVHCPQVNAYAGGGCCKPAKCPCCPCCDCGDNCPCCK